jgi:hypothetical protein
MIKEYPQVINYLIIYLICSITFGIYKAETLIQYFPKKYISTIRVSSYVSVIIGNAISMIVLFFLLILIYYLTQYLKLGITNLSFVDASTTLISLLILTEMIKLVLVYLFLKEEATGFKILNLDFQEQLNNTNFYKLAKWANTISIPIRVLLFFATLHKHNVKFSSNLVCSIFLLVLLSFIMIS